MLTQLYSILWIAVFGVFAQIYMNWDPKHAYEGTDTSQMKVAMWMDLINVILWFGTMTTGLLGCLGGRKDRTLQTGHAKN